MYIFDENDYNAHFYHQYITVSAIRQFTLKLLRTVNELKTVEY